MLDLGVGRRPGVYQGAWSGTCPLCNGPVKLWLKG